MDTMPNGWSREFSSIAADGEVEVVDVAPEGPAALSGVRPGDTIVAVNGRVVVGVDDIHRLLKSFPTESPIMLAILRDGEPIDVVIPPKRSEST